LGRIEKGQDAMNNDNETSRFMTTRWSVIMKAQGDDSVAAADSIAELCRDYWYPLYAYVRRCGVTPEDAQDFTQGFFSSFLQNDWVMAVHQSRGKFRSFLLASIKNYMGKQWQKQKTIKRGGGIQFSSVDFETAEGRYINEPFHDLTPDKLFDRSWTISLLDSVLKELKNDYVAKGNEQLFEMLKDFLVAKTGNMAYAEIAEHLGMTESAVKVAVHRLRSRYRQLIRERVAQTVSDEEDVASEIHGLFSSLSS